MNDEFNQLPKKVQKVLQAAIGWLHLGNWTEARKELDEGAGEFLTESLVAGLYLEILSTGKQWRHMQVMADGLRKMYPKERQWIISYAYATRRVESIGAARIILLEAREKFPEDALVTYNLACYAAQLGDLNEAKAFLTIAVKLDKIYKDLALTDADLEPIREFTFELHS